MLAKIDCHDSVVDVVVVGNVIKFSCNFFFHLSSFNLFQGESLFESSLVKEEVHTCNGWEFIAHITQMGWSREDTEEEEVVNIF